MDIGSKLSWVITNRSMNNLKMSFSPYILPAASLLVWNEGNVSGKEFLSFLFGVQHKNICFPSSLKCSTEASFDDFVTKVQRKLIQIKFPEVKLGQTFDASLFHNIEVSAGKMSDSTVGDIVKNNEAIEIAGIRYRIIRNPLDISLMVSSTRLLPIVGCPLVPTMESRNGERLQVFPELHWFVGDPVFIKNDIKKKSQNARDVVLVPPNDICLENEISRTFKVSNFEFRSKGLFFVPEEKDVGKQIIFICDSGADSVVRCGLISDIIQSLPERPLYEDRLLWSSAKKHGLRIVTYNILANLYLKFNVPKGQLYFPYCEVEYQNPEYRYALLLRELRGYDADIYFMQEVDEVMEKRFLLPIFESMNINFIFEKKRKKAENSYVGEGTAIAYKRNIFRKVEHWSFCLANLLDENKDVLDVLETSKASYDIFCTRPTTLQIVVLENIKSKEIIVCGTTHLHFKPTDEHIKAFQAIIAVRKLYNIAEKFPQKPKVIFAGDFNSLPDGPVYTLLEKGFLSADDNCWKNDAEIVPKQMKLLPDLVDSPLVDHIRSDGYTNFTEFSVNGDLKGFRGVLDYIWTDGFKLNRLAPPICHNLVIKYQAIPSKLAPSDHLPIIAEFESINNLMNDK